MLEPPDLSVPFSDDRERALCLAELLMTSERLEQLQELSQSTDDGALDALVVSKRISGDTPQLRLSNWVILFNEELREVLEARSRAVHGVRLGDAELRGASWLAKHLLELIEPS